MKASALVCASLVAAVSAKFCTDGERVYTDLIDIKGTHFGEDGNATVIDSVGTARAFFVPNKDTGNPYKVGVELQGQDLVDQELMYSSPLPPPAGVGDAQFNIPCTEAFASTPFQYASVGPVRNGHAPNIFMTPHYDFHFFILPPIKIDGQPNNPSCVPPAPPGPPQDFGTDYFCFYSTPPTADNATGLPTPFWGAECPSCDAEEAYTTLPCTLSKNFQPLIAIPYMGNHVVPSKYPAYEDGPIGCQNTTDGVSGWVSQEACFKHAPIIGTYDGDIVFFEPMITVEYLDSLDEGDLECFDFGIEETDSFTSAGWYPLQYCVTKTDFDTWEVYLTDFNWFEAADKCPE